MSHSLLASGLRKAATAFAEPLLGADAGPRAVAAADVTSQSVTGSFGSGILSVFGDSLANSVDISRNAAGQILVNGGAVPVVGGTATVANTRLVQVFGQGGNDTIALNEANGALPAATLFGGAGNDVLTGGSGADMLFGQGDNDTLNGKGGADLLFGGAGDDVLTGGDADDQMFGEAGNDRLIWNPGDDSDLFEGGAGIDTAEVNGGNGAETFTVTANGARVRIDRVTPAPFAIDAGTMEKVVINANGGDDIVTAGNGLATLVQLTIDGGTGNDTITGGDGADLLIGGDGNDTITGGRGNDTALLGAGDDSFIWNPGDGSDVVEGQAGFDTMVFNGANIAERIDLAANGGRLRFTRDVANITMDSNDVERVAFTALGGSDDIHVGDLSGTDVQAVAIELAGTPGGTAGDGQADTVRLDGTAAADVVEVLAGAGTLSVLGLPALVQVAHADAGDRLLISGGGGDDQLGAASVASGLMALTLDGGAGNDTLIGSAGADQLLGGNGNDLVVGGRGDDTALLGAGNDSFVWNPGDGSDVVEGGAGDDTMLFNGANIAENIDIAANGGRVRFTRDVAGITMDTDDIEHFSFNAFGGADNIVLGDMSGTDLRELEVSLGGGPGQAGDGQRDSVTTIGTAGADTVTVAGGAGQTIVAGLPVTTSITGADGGLDQLVVAAGAGDDVVDASALAAGGLRLTLQGGDGSDRLIGSAGDDLVVGGRGDDVGLLGAGDDTFVWSPGEGSDIVEGQAGTDTMLFNGANIAEQIDIAANGGRVRFFRDVANITMDLNDTEVIDFRALGGADTIVVHDLSGTDTKEVHIDLAASGGTAGDGQADRIVIEGSEGDDAVTLAMDGDTLVVDGLAARIVIEHFDGNLDRLQFNGGGGNDVIDASALAAGIVLGVDAGAGDDVVLGGDGNDQLLGGDGDDVILGGAGDDLLDGGAGDDVLLGGGGNDVLLNGEIQIQDLVIAAVAAVPADGLFA